MAAVMMTLRSTKRRAPGVLHRGHVLVCSHGDYYLSGWEFDPSITDEGDRLKLALSVRRPHYAVQVPGCNICEALWLY